MQLRVSCEPGLGCSTSSPAARSTVLVHILPQDAGPCQEQLDRLCGLLLMEGSVLGLDCEWQPETKGLASKVAVVQVSSSADCLLLQPLYLGISSTALPAPPAEPSEGLPPPLPSFEAPEPTASFPPALRALLEDPSVIKAGVGIYEDVSPHFCGHYRWDREHTHSISFSLSHTHTRGWGGVHTLMHNT